MRFPRIAGGSALALSLLIASAGNVLAAPMVTVEAGAFSDFVAPDAGTSTPGSITFGLNGTAEVIAADAVLAPPADTVLASLAGGPPTCIQTTRDGGVITALAFVPTCTVRETVVFVADAFGPGENAYALGDRVIAPETLVLSNPGINALFATAADAGAELSLTFTVDTGTGLPFALDALVQLNGPVSMLGNGDVTVGPATLLAVNIDAAERAMLQQAADLGVDAAVEVHGAGSLDLSTGDITVDITLAITFAVPTAPTPTPTPTASPSPIGMSDTGTALGEQDQGSPLGFVVALLGFIGFIGFIGRRRAQGMTNG